ncbi:MAG: alpha/beta hydrolase family protein [Bacteroidales bacterium]
MKKLLFIILAISVSYSTTITAQENVNYQTPSEEILKLVDEPLTPNVRIDSRGENMVLLYRDQFKSLEELLEKEMRLGGIRINPKTNIGSRERFYNNLAVMRIGEKEEIEVKGLPENPRISNIKWSPDERMMAFTHTTEQGVELWALDIKKAEVIKLTNANLNANMGETFDWFNDNQNLLVKFIPENRKELIDKSKAIPEGPRVSINKGQKAQNRTYQDLLNDKTDEFNFEQLVISDLYKVNLKGEKSLWKETAMYRSMEFSPDGKYVLISTVEKPFSYLVPYYRFPSRTIVYDTKGEKIKTIEEVPLTEDLPKGFMAVRTGKRNIQWRNDKPSAIFFAEALDEGDPENEVDYRDEIFEWEAPFSGEPSSLLKTINRFRDIMWGNDNTAVAFDNWWNTRNTKTYAFNPSNPEEKATVLFDRNYQDRYNDPGMPATTKNKFGKEVLDIEGDYIYLLGDGHSDEGILPFVDKFNIKTEESERLWRAESNKKLERIISALDVRKGEIVTRIESNKDYPNYYIRDIKTKDKPEPITYFENPFEELSNAHKEVIKYTREDGIDLSATLYLPPDYDKEKKEELPMLMWAYPREYKDKSSASQVTSSPYKFTYPSYGSPIFWVMKGYAVLDNTAFPIIGEGDEEPNDNFIEQLVANAKAAIDKVDNMGYIDRDRVAVGGHSYGAFMTANLLTHSDLFTAGIGRSGAYNRTLTPFGFQAEERTYWEAPEIYYEMSPFMHADEMETPLLLIHGEADNNSGTYPMQSERYFNALKGLGANVRLVMLPKESHGYAAKKNILHMLWEQDRWLEKYLKNNPDDNK